MLGKKVKKYLVDNGIKQSFLAEKTGLSNTIISDICTGQRKIEATEFFLICDALGISLESLRHYGESNYEDVN